MLYFDMFRNDPEFVEINSGDVLFSEGDSGDAMYVLVAGEAQISIDGVVFEKCTQGSCVGEMAVLDGLPRYGTVTALTNCRFILIDKKRFQFLVDESPGFALELMRVIARRLKKVSQRIIQSASEKVA